MGEVIQLFGDNELNSFAEYRKMLAHRVREAVDAAESQDPEKIAITERALSALIMENPGFTERWTPGIIE